ncbi:MAG: alcohol dehydrogenase catalytic domain-containing protein [Candidatus Bruticola sp.]
MKSIFFDRELQIREFIRPQVPPTEALIRVNLAGICNTDLELCRGYMNFKGVLGHEFVGVVEELGPGASRADLERWLHKRVVGEINCGCGSCSWCLSHDDARHCPNRTTLGIDRRNGVFAPYTVLPLKNLMEVPSSVSDHQAVFTEPLAAAWEILEQLHIEPNAKVVILGDGKLGLMAAFVLRLSCAEVLLVGRHPHKLQMAAKLGIRTKLLHNFRPDNQADIAVEATGSSTGLQLAADCVKPRGTIVLKTTAAAGAHLNLSPIVVKEITILGSRCGPFAPALKAMATGLIDPEPLISAVYPLNEGLAAFRKAQERSSLKVLIDTKIKK